MISWIYVYPSIQYEILYEEQVFTLTLKASMIYIHGKCVQNSNIVNTKRRHFYFFRLKFLGHAGNDKGLFSCVLQITSFAYSVLKFMYLYSRYSCFRLICICERSAKITYYITNSSYLYETRSSIPREYILFRENLPVRKINVSTPTAHSAPDSLFLILITSKATGTRYPD